MSLKAPSLASAPPALAVALLTVCVERPVAELLVRSTVQTPWAVEPLEFEHYMSALQRPQLSQSVKDADAVIAVVDFDRDTEQALESVAYLQRLFAGRIALIGLCRHPEANLLLRAMRAGCNEVLKKPLEPGQFDVTLHRLEQQWSDLLGQKHTLGQILSFFGAKGGVGTTMTATQLAVFLVLTQKKKVLLIDNHRQLGHTCLYLGLDGTRYHFDELIRNVDRLDSELLGGFIATHSSGLDVLSSPDLHEEVRSIDPEAIERTLEFLRGEYDFVLVDCETSLSEANLAVMNCSDQIYLVATAEIGAIRDLSRYVDGLIHNARTTERLHVVLNRYSSQSSVGIEHIEKAIRLSVEIKICNNYFECVQSANVGEPIPPERKSEYATQFAQWAGALAGSSEAHAAAPAKKRFTLWR